MRFRTLFNTIGPLLLVGVLFALDPDNGLGLKIFSPGTTVLLLKYLSGLLVLSGAFWFLKLMLDYPEADTRNLFRQVESRNPAAGYALVARAIFFFAIVYAIATAAHAAPDVRTYIPAQAKTYAPMLKAEQVRFWANHPRPEMLAGLAEQESCLYLTHPKCFNPASRLKSAREEGAGIPQITRAYRKDGTERFDALSEMRSSHRELAELTWNNVYLRPDLQMRVLVLKNLDNFKALAVIKDQLDKLDFTDGSYNAGRGRIVDRRRACGLKVGCNPQVWFGNVENICLTGTKPLYGKRTACDIVKEHVLMVSKVRSPKYKALML